MLLISDALCDASLKLHRTDGSMHLFKIKRKLTPEHVKLRTNILELEWNDINMTLNQEKI